MLALPVRAGQLQNLAPPGLADGAGIWVNMWHWPDGNLDAYCTKLRANGVRNIFLQTSRSNTDAIVHPDQLGPILDTCHRYKIRVIAWSFAELDNPAADADRAIKAAQFRSARGNSFDGIAGNMEKNLAVQRVEEYTSHLRQALGHNYPLIAVVYSPLNRAPAVAQIPWTLLGKSWDVIAPMTYWGGRYQKLDAYTYTVSTIQAIRRLTGRPDVEIHVIGDGMGTTSEQVQQFLLACRKAQAASASLYPNHVPTPDQLASLGRYRDYFPNNSRFRLAAYRALTSSGLLDSPPKGDPSQPIARSEFYRLVARQLFKRNPNEDLSIAQALEILGNAGVLPPKMSSRSGPIEELLAQPVDALEAISVIAGSVEFQSSSPAGVTPRYQQPASAANHRPDRWLVQPANAESSGTSREPESPTVSQMDVAEMLLQARAGMR